jgi:hypothetical protein
LRTVAWRDDPEIVERVGVVGTLYLQPLSTALVAVNQWCRDRGLATISYETIKDDRKRFLETLHDENRAGAQARIVELEQQRAAVWRDLAATPPGSGRVGLYTEARLLTLAIARMEGSIPPQGLDPIGAGSGARLDDLPSPEELNERGALTLADYQGFLRTIALQISGPPQRLVQPDVIEGDVVQPGEAVAARKPSTPKRAQPAPLAGRGGRAGLPLEPARRSGIRVWQPT